MTCVSTVTCAASWRQRCSPATATAGRLTYLGNQLLQTRSLVAWRLSPVAASKLSEPTGRAAIGALQLSRRTTHRPALHHVHAAATATHPMKLETGNHQRSIIHREFGRVSQSSFCTSVLNPTSPNHALQRTAPRVTLAAADHPAACAHPAPAAFPQPARRAPQSLSLGSLDA